MRKDNKFPLKKKDTMQFRILLSIKSLVYGLFLNIRGNKFVALTMDIDNLN